MSPAGTERRLAAIMFTDIVGYTALMGRDEAAGRRVRERHEAVVRPLVDRYHGEWVEERGDESLSTFVSALDAVNCALAIQSELAGDAELSLRIGIHLGDVTVEGGRVFGDGVNVASRIRALSEPRGICLSEPVHDSVKNQPGLGFHAMGQRELKNVEKPMAIYRVDSTAPVATPASARLGRPSSRAALWTVAVVAPLLLIAAVAWWLNRPSAEDAALPPIRSIAVLPLENLSGDPEQEYFTAGMTEALISDLAKIASLGVVSRTSVMQYAGARKPLSEIALELGVDAVVEGSVLRAGRGVRVSVQLIDARRDRHLWSRSYERELRDILRLQSEVARAVAREVQLKLAPTDQARLTSTRPVNPEAYEAYLKGQYLLGKQGASNHRRAIQLLEQAVEADPDSAPAWAALAIGYT